MSTDLAGRTVIVTGASSGIGAVTARQLAAYGADVVPVGRSPERTAQVARSIGVEPEVADFARLDEVRALAERLRARCPRVDVLIHNAGGIHPRRVRTVDGHELTFQTNHLAPFLLNALLVDRLLATPDSRVIVTSSSAHRTGRLDLDDLDRTRGRYRSFATYGAAKLANILFTRELARRLAATTSSAVCVHPGAVASGFARDNVVLGLVYRSPLARLALITPEQGAQPLVHLATLDDARPVNGAYFDRLHGPARTSAAAHDASLAVALWEASQVMLDVDAGLPA